MNKSVKHLLISAKIPDVAPFRTVENKSEGHMLYVEQDGKCYSVPPGKKVELR